MASTSCNVSSLFLGAMAIIIFFHCSLAWSHPSNHLGWQSFRTLSGCDLGERRPGLADLKRYLHHFGYLHGNTPGGNNNFTDDFDVQLESALITYQNFFHLNVTGRLDASTLDLITAPRCGLPDVNMVINSTATYDHRRSLYSYFDGMPVWPKRHLQYTFTSTAVAPANWAAVRALFARAFARWSAASPLSFSETISQGYADITIAFTRLDGRGNYLAWSFAPTDGRMLVDQDEPWWVQFGGPIPNWAYDLESVAVHEIGHLLGLYHSSDPGAIMFPSIPPGSRKVSLSWDDVAGISGLYRRRA